MVRSVRTKSREYHRSRSPVKAAAARRLERLEEQLEDLFLSEGFLHLSTDELARRLRCSKRALYQLAPSREELFERIVERFLANLRAAGEAAAAAAPDPFAAVTDYLGVAVTATRGASAQFFRDVSRLPAAHRRLMSHQRERMLGLERLIERGVERGAFRGIHPRLVADMLLQVVPRLVDPDVLAQLGLSVSEAFEELYKIIEYGLLPRDAADGRREVSPRHARRAGLQTPRRT
jgi:AcrR family transcriptional regulator